MSEPDRVGRRPPAVAVVALAMLCVGIVVTDIVVVDRRGAREGVPYGSLRAGDCIDRPPSTVTSVHRVPCGRPHELEVVTVSDDRAPRGAAYPGTARLIEQGAAACVPAARAAAGARDPAQLEQVVMVPERRSWERGDRRLVCTLGCKDTRRL